MLISAANRIAETAFAPDGKPSGELLDMAEQEVFRIAEGRLRDSGPEKVVPLLHRAVERIEKLYETRNPITGVATGFELVAIRGVDPEVACQPYELTLATEVLVVIAKPVGDAGIAVARARLAAIHPLVHDVLWVTGALLITQAH